MVITITSKRQVTFPKRLMEHFHLKAGDTLSVTETPEGILIRPRRFDISNFAPLKGLVQPDLPAPDIEAMRHAAIDHPELRD